MLGLLHSIKKVMFFKRQGQRHSATEEEDSDDEVVEKEPMDEDADEDENEPLSKSVGEMKLCVSFMFQCSN